MNENTMMGLGSIPESDMKAIVRKSMTIIALNPNGIRAYFKNSIVEVKRMIKEHNPDIIIWNEIKGNENKQNEMQKQVDEVMDPKIFHWYWNNSERALGRHGLCISMKKELVPLVKSVSYGFKFEQNKEPEGRIITLEFEEFSVVGIYAVNAGAQKCDKLHYKQEWLAKLMIHCEMLKGGENGNPLKGVIVMGDWNIAPKDVDIHNPTKNQKSAGFTKEEREAFQWFMDRGWCDVFRLKHPYDVKYTFWDSKFAARQKGAGWRIDHTVVNKEFSLEKATCEILDDIQGSDHCPVMFQFEY